MGASSRQISMLYSRYAWAAPFCSGKDVLEVGCGAGMGLGYLARTACRVVGGDYSRKLLCLAREHYRDRVPLFQLDAQRLPFRERSFDVVILYEAIYYLAEPDRFVSECRRVLRAGGTVLICTVNPEWRDFNPSPFSKRYLSAAELANLLRRHNFEPEVAGGFPAANGSPRDRVVSLIKRTAVALHLIPRTMRGKLVLKRVFFGRLMPIPHEVTDGMAPYLAPERLPLPGPNARHTVLYAAAHAR